MWHAWWRGKVLTGFWLGGPKVRDHWEDIGVGGRITLKWTLGFCEHGDELSGSIRRRDIF
jgi:hypothetical protein